MKKKFHNHIIICNWSEKGEKIITELHSPLAAPDNDIIVISTIRPTNEMLLRDTYPDEYSNVEFREGNPIYYETLKRAGAHKAKAVIILSYVKSGDPDSEAALITLAINTLWQKEAKGEYKKPRIVVEVQDHLKMQHLKDAGADDVICAADYAIGIIAQSAINIKLADVYHDLLTYRENTSEIYIIDNPIISDWINGKTFKEVSKFFIQNRCSINPGILLGLRQGENIVMNPKKDIKFTKNDALIVLAYDMPDVVKMISPADQEKD